MNTRPLIAAAVLALTAATGFAAEEQFVPPAGTKTRAEVIAEFQRARAAGELPQAGEAYGEVVARPAAPSTLTRAEVKAEFERARAAGELPLNEEAARRATPAATRAATRPADQQSAQRSLRGAGAAPNPSYAPVQFGG